LAQDDGASADEPSFSVNALFKLQGGLFVPLASNGFAPHENRALYRDNGFFGGECDPVALPQQPCYPQDHGQKPGSPSITRATLQIEAHWDLTRWFGLHAIVRGTRSMELPADEYAQVPTSLDPLGTPTNPEPAAELSARRRAYAKRWVRDNQYNTFELREFYADIMALDWLSFRIGRQQVAWGETGSFRLLDVINPINSTWHFGPLESFEDQRIPLWMALAVIELPKLRGALELVYIPGIDRARDTVSTPLSMSGAWGAPYSNRPSAYRASFKDFQYPGGSLDPDHMRYGVRWKGELGESLTYSLVYVYTHMQTPVLQRAYMLQDGVTDDGVPIYSALTSERAVLNFPRAHVAGLSAEYTFPSPLGLTLRFEGAFEPNRTYSNNTENSVAVMNGVQEMSPRSKKVANYAFVVQRPTMIRWLNPVQHFLLAAQFQHTHVFDVDDLRDHDLVAAIGYNDWRIPQNSYVVSGMASTQYLRGLITPRVIGAVMINPDYKDDVPDPSTREYELNQHIASGFVSFDVGFRVGPHYRFNLTITDFFSKHPYRDFGLFRDRDEIHASMTVLL
jgi:hypothetical protein